MTQTSNKVEGNDISKQLEKGEIFYETYFEDVLVNTNTQSHTTV